MNGKRLGIVCALVTLGGFGLLRMALADDIRPQVPSFNASNEGGGGSSEYSYVGSNKCKKCHIKEYKSWEDTKMGKALETLMPGKVADVKKAHGLDPEKDYSTDAKCLKCHTVGYGHDGGYAVPAAGDKKAERHAKYTANVGCEMCHGPGSKYIEVFEEIFKSKRKYKPEELYAAGMTKIEESTCTSCHNEESPTHDASKPFDFEQQKKEGLHEQFPLEQRE